MISVINRPFLLMIFFLIMPLEGVNIVVVNDQPDPALKHKVWLKFILEPGEIGILKNTLQFSVDHPDVNLVAWNSSAIATDYFSTSRKKTLKIYCQDFTGCLSLEHKRQTRTQFYVSCFIMRANGKTRSLGKMLVLGTPQEMLPELQRQSQVSSGKKVCQLPALMPVQDLAQSFEPIEHLGALWTRLCNKLAALFFGKAFYWCYGMVFLLFCAFYFKRRFGWLHFIAPLQGATAREVMVLLGFLLVSGSLYILQFVIATAWSLYAFGALCCAAMLYVLLTPISEERFLGRLKSLIGVMLGSLVLPVMLKAYLMQHGL